jgi:hypothetical protein
MLCIKGVSGHTVSFDSSSVKSQLPNAILAQNKEAMESNNLATKKLNAKSKTKKQKRKNKEDPHFKLCQLQHPK